MKRKYLLTIAAFAFITAGMISADLFMPADRPLAFVRKFRPAVMIQSGPESKAATRAAALYNGDTLSTGQNGLALVQFMDKSLVTVQPNSMLIVQGEVGGKEDVTTRIILEAGEIFSNVTERPTNSFEVATNTAVASVKGTEFGASSDDYFWVDQGTVIITSQKTGDTVTLLEKMYAQVQSDGDIETGTLSDEELEALKDKYKEVEEEIQPSVLNLVFRDKNGQTRRVQIRYYKNN